MDAERVGLAALALGAGRDRADAGVDPAAGIDVLQPVGAHVRAGDAVLRLLSTDPARLSAAVRTLDRAIEIADTAPARRPLIQDVVPAAATAMHG
jgi:pyrimidine-nucleoside phosphorylase